MLKIEPQKLLGSHDIVFITLDTLRYDAACQANLPNLGPWVGEWEKRHTPASFTYAAHQAFFAGFLPTPARPGKHPRLFAARFAGSETTGPHTYVFETSDIVSGLAGQGYYSICIGGVGFFSRQNPLSCVLPDLFHESHWSPALGVADPQSAQNQIALACERLAQFPPEQRLFLFINIAAIHQPNYFYLSDSGPDSLASHIAALEEVDRQFPPLLAALQARADSLMILCSDHGTAYGEEGYSGHRLGHPVVWEVPYAEFILPRRPQA